MATEERSIIGRLASDRGESTGNFLRRMFVAGMKAEGLNVDAATIEEIRRARAALIGLLIFLFAFVAPSFGITKKAFKDMRRARTIRAVRILREFETVEA